jgi:phosphoribosylcarboxyaminoimidazole (NCAIR) mutase
VPALGAVAGGAAALPDNVAALAPDPDCAVEPRLVPPELLEAPELDGIVAPEPPSP